MDPVRTHKAKVNAEFQRAHLVARCVYTPGPHDESVGFETGDPVMKTVVAMRERLAAMNASKGMLTQGWMRSALFLRMVYLMKGGEGFDVLADAIWAYTAALVDNLEKVSSDADILSDVPPEGRYAAWREMMLTLKKGLAVQVKLLNEIKSKKIEFESGEKALEYGRRLLRTVHFPRYEGEDFIAFADAITKFGPGGLPDVKGGEWAQAVALAKAILKYEESREPDPSDNAPETDV